MARDYLDLGCTPVEENCAQVGKVGYLDRARAECREFIGQLRRQFGPEPVGCKLAVKSNPHDFGSYLSVVVYFDDAIEESITYAFKLEADLPEYWDDTASFNLGHQDAALDECDRKLGR